MRGLAELEHHEVGDVHDVVDGTNADGLDFRAQPIGTRSDFATGDLACGIKRTFLWPPAFLWFGHPSCCPTKAEISRANPKWLSKSPRFGVISTSRIMSLGKRSAI